VVVYEQEEEEEDLREESENEKNASGSGEESEGREDDDGEGPEGEEDAEHANPETGGGQEEMEVGTAAAAANASEGAAATAEAAAVIEPPAAAATGDGTLNVGQVGVGDGGEDEEVLEEESEDRPDESLKPTHLYHAVRSLLSGAMEPRKLNKRMKLDIEDSGFCQPGDERWYRNQNTNSMERRVNCFRLLHGQRMVPHLPVRQTRGLERQGGAASSHCCRRSAFSCQPACLREGGVHESDESGER
jgi:hypothetical protein